MSDDWKVAKGTALEDIVARLLRGWNFDIQTRVRARDKSGVEHEIDVLGRRTEGFGGFTLAVECKNHVEPIDIVQVRNFNDKLSSLGYSKGLFVSTGGFTPPALQYAKSVGIEVWDNVKLKENLDKAKSTVDQIPNALVVSSDFSSRLLPPLLNANKLQLESSSLRYSPYFFVTYHCFTQQWVNYQLTNLESEGLAVVDAITGTITDFEVRSGAVPQISQTKDFASCDAAQAGDIPKVQVNQNFRETSVVPAKITESEARQKVQLEVTKNTFQNHSYQAGRGRYVHTEQKTVRPKVSDVSIMTSRLVNIPIVTVVLGYKGTKYERMIQAATMRNIKDDFWTCSYRGSHNSPNAICEECGRVVCDVHGKPCAVCGGRFCLLDIISKGLVQKKFYCKHHALAKAQRELGANSPESARVNP